MSDWRQQGKCNDADPDVFFYLDPSAAIDVCKGCPVKTNCLQWAMDHDPQFGAWGGTTESQRMALRRRENAARASNPDVVARREKVALWSSRGLPPAEIASLLETTAEIVSADLQRMKTAA